MKRYGGLLLGLFIILGVPFLLRRGEEKVGRADVTLVVITPHVEAIRHEFGLGFRDWYFERTGKVAAIDWRVIGGTSDITRYLTSEYLNAFRLHWERDLGRRWNYEVQGSYANPRVVLDDTPEDDTEAEAARRAFLASNVGVNLDVFFGGGAFDFIQQAEAGRLVDGGLQAKFPEWFKEPGEAGPGIPRLHSGEVFFDAAGRWYGTVVSSFGIVYNTDLLAAIGIPEIPHRWIDLTNPRLRGRIAVADPSKSGVMNKIFELIIQEQMQARFRQYRADGLSEEEAKAVALPEGWYAGMKIIQQLAANARYFTDSSTKPSLDVAAGDCAVGISIDFYGRYQAENIAGRGGVERFGYLTPTGGSSASVDPIGLLRGAPSRELAEAFLEYVMSHEGQKLWNFKPGTPGGPREYALRRPPVRPDLYVPEYTQFRSDPTVNPYEEVAGFDYRSEWTGGLFSQIRFILKTCFIDLHPEVREAWDALIAADFPPEATALFHDIRAIDWDAAQGPIRTANRSRQRLDEVVLARELAAHFRDRYAEVVRLAQAGR